VVDTIALNDRPTWTTTHAAYRELHVVERWRLIDDKMLEVEFTVTIRTPSIAPWTVALPFRRMQRPLFDEEVCAENNEHLFDYHTPVADKPDF